MQQQNRRLTYNNFDLLRLLFAGTVCMVHTYELSGYQALARMTNILSSDVAVRGFFVVSGFLIFMSFERSSSLLSYAGKRIRRIYPAYLTAVNGALWTLKVEVMFYMAVPFFVFLFKRVSRLPVILLVYAASIAWAVLMAALSERTGAFIYTELGRQIPGQLSYFISGAFLYYYLPLFERRAGVFLMAAVPVLVIDTHFFPLPMFEPFALAVVVIFSGIFFYMGNAGKFGDFSYGIYILHFPLIQLLLHSGWFEKTPWGFLAAIIFLTTTGAMLLWHLVEKKFLFRTSHYMAALPSSALCGRSGLLPSTPLK